MSSVSYGSLLNKVGYTLQQVLEACELDWSKKGLRPEDVAAIAALLPGCVNLRSIRCVHGFEHRTRLGTVTLLKPLNVRGPPFAFSLAQNNLTNYGKDMSGVIALAAALKDSQIVNLK